MLGAACDSSSATSSSACISLHPCCALLHVAAAVRNAVCVLLVQHSILLPFSIAAFRQRIPGRVQKQSCIAPQNLCMRSSGMSTLQRLLFLAFVLAVCPSVLALFEDEAGKYERSIRAVGPVSHALWLTEGSDRAIVVASQQTRVVASLKPKSGDFSWRRLLPQGERVVHISKAGELVFVLSRSDSGSATLRAILSATGAFVNEVHLHSCAVVALLPFACDSKHCAAVVCTDGVSAYGTKGQLLFQHGLTNVAAAVVDAASSMATVFRVNQSHVSALSLNLPAGASTPPRAEESTSIPPGACSQHVVSLEAGAASLLCFQPSSGAVRVFNSKAALLRGPVAVSYTGLASLLVMPIILLQVSIPNSGLCVECGASASLAAITSSVAPGTRTLALPVSGSGGAKAGEPYSAVKIYGGLAVQVQCKGKDLRVHVSASESSPAVDYTFPWSHPCPDLMFVDIGSNAALRLLLVSPSGAVGYFVNGTAKWVRHESLADVQEVQVLPLPLALTVGSKGKEAKPSLASRLLDSAMSFVTKVAPQLEDEVELSEQLIIALTSSGQVTAPSASSCHCCVTFFAGVRNSQRYGIRSLVSLPWIVTPTRSEHRRRLSLLPSISNSRQEAHCHPHDQ